MMMDDRGYLPPMPEASDGLAEPIDPLQGQSHPEPDPDGLVEDSMRTAFDVWHRLVEDATNVGVKNLVHGGHLIQVCEGRFASSGPNLCTASILAIAVASCEACSSHFD